LLWVELLICAAAILLAGIQLSKYGDQIAELTGLGRSWIGLILLASVTSLPELISGISAVTLNDLPDVAVGGVVGSCLFNLVILAMLDVAAGSTPLSHRIQNNHIISAGFGIILLCLVGVSKLFLHDFALRIHLDLLHRNARNVHIRNKTSIAGTGKNAGKENTWAFYLDVLAFFGRNSGSCPLLA
jgi:Ca2+/Na+ antiporter